MKEIIKNGIEKLPLVYQLADVVKIDNSKTKLIKGLIKMEVYNSDASQAIRPNKPISKII